MKPYTLKIPNYFTLDKRYVWKFVRVLDKLYHANRDTIYLDFTSTKVASKGDIMVLLAQLEKIKSKKQVDFYYKGKNTRIIEQILNCDILRLKKDLSSIEVKIDADKFRTLDPLVVANITKNLKKIGINKNNAEHIIYYERVETLLTEIVGNAIEHGIRNRDINCWLTTEVDNKTKKVVFAFVDMGEGIARSHRKARLPFNYRVSTDSKIVNASLAGDLPSSTKEPNRGKGLPEIRSIVEKGYVVDFELITNKVAIDYDGGRFNSQKIPNFVGTYYSWTVTKENFEKWKSMQ